MYAVVPPRPLYDFTALCFVLSSFTMLMKNGVPQNARPWGVYPTCCNYHMQSTNPFTNFDLKG
jgi:hypothetical protein